MKLKPGQCQPYFGVCTDGRRDVISIVTPDGQTSFVDIRTVLAMCPEFESERAAREFEDALQREGGAS